MKLSVFFLLCSICLAQAADSYAQKATVNIEMRNQTVKEVLNEIEKQSDFSFFFNIKHVDLQRIVSVVAEKSDIFKVLDKVFAGTSVHYSVVDRKIILSTENQNALQNSGEKQVTGIVKDATGEPIIGANIVEKGTTNGVVTDIDGKFVLTVSDNAVIQVSYIGYIEQDIAVVKKSDFAITLKENSQTLDEVVVVGYGTMKKRDLTGAVSSVKFSDTPIQTVATASHALAGKAAGLNVIQTSAQVGGGATFRIRGEASTGAGNDPLIIIDGFPVSVTGSLSSGNRYDAGSTDNILESINPNDIESVEILKDASSTAIYGARAGHGVIIITTKRGTEGKVSVNYSGTITAQKMKNSFKMLGAEDFMLQNNRYYKEIWMKENGQGIYADYITPNSNPKPFVAPYSQEQINNVALTPWFDLVTRSGLMHQHNVSLNGGTKTTKYLASINYMNQAGVLKNNDMERMTVKVNLDQQVSDRVTTGISLNISRNSYDNVPLGTGQWESAGLIASAVGFNPTLPVYNEDGTFFLNPKLPNVPNPVSLLEITDKTLKDRLLGSVFVEAEILKGLKLKANFGVDRRFQKRSNYLPKGTKWGGSANGKASISEVDNTDYLMDLTANYLRQFGKHNLNMLVGYSYQKFTEEGFSAGNEDFIIDSFLYHNLGAGNFSKPSVGSSGGTSSIGSYFARVSYSLMDKYLLTATIRADGASNLAKGNQWGCFPSVSAGWRFVDESFIKSWADGFLSNGKLRLSWGQTGNSNIGNRALDFYGTGYTTLFGTESANPGVLVSQLGNPNLTWETTTEMNIGLDLGFFNDRLNITAEYFDRTISDLLVKEKVLLNYNELTKIAANIGETQSQGFELTVNSRNIMTNNFTWNTDLTLSTYSDRWKERDPDWAPAFYQKKDDPIRALFAYRSDGLLKAGEKAPAHQPLLLPGQIKLKDLNNDGVLNDEDKEMIGKSDPAFFFGLNNTFRYKGFDLNLYFYGEVGKTMGSSYYEDWSINGGKLALGENMSLGFKDTFSSDNQNAKYPSFISSNYDSGDYFYRKVSFVRLRNVTLGYTVPVKKNILNKLRVYVDVNNPFVITNWTGQDPETDNHAFAYPNVTSMSFGVDVTF